MHEKSEGMLQYEREMANLEKRIGRGEFGNWEAIDAEYVKILTNAAPAMSEDERLRIRDRDLAVHGVGAKILAEEGHPVPGNDPSRPN